MASKYLIVVLSCLYSMAVIAEAENIFVQMNIAAENKEAEVELLTWEGMKQALQKELAVSAINPEEFWKKLEMKKNVSKLPTKDSVELLRPMFDKVQLEVAAPLDVKAPTDLTNTASSARFVYETTPERIKRFSQMIISDLPDVTLKNFYISAEIEIDKALKWEDLGVTKAENFSGVIKDSWKKLAMEQVKGFDHYVVLSKDLERFEEMNPKSVVLKWKSSIKKIFEDKEKQSARFEIIAQYILVNAKTGENMLAFDFPVQKREFSSHAKTLSSGLASLIYNLLNSQSGKIKSMLESSLSAQIVVMEEFKMTGAHGLSELYQAIAWLNENMKERKLNFELKTFANPGSILLVKSALTSAQLTEIFSANGSRFAFNEQKILVFNPADKTFAIIPKDGNN